MSVLPLAATARGSKVNFVLSPLSVVQLLGHTEIVGPLTYSAVITTCPSVSESSSSSGFKKWFSTIPGIYTVFSTAVETTLLPLATALPSHSHDSFCALAHSARIEIIDKVKMFFVLCWLLISYLIKLCYSVTLHSAACSTPSASV